MLPLPGETLGSFLSRWAWARGEEPASLSHRLGLGYRIWCQDLDRSLPDAKLRTIATAAGVEVSRIQGMTYSALLAKAHVPVHRNGFQPWLSPVGLYHRRRLRFGQLYCPLCLKEDTQRHVHRDWRLASTWLCSQHKVCLMDSCPNCGVPFAPYRNDSLLLGRCESCAFALSTARPANCSAHQLGLQARIEALWALAAEGDPLPLSHAYITINRIAKHSPDFAYAGEPWSYWRVLQRGQLLEAVFAKTVAVHLRAHHENATALYRRAEPVTRARPRTCWQVPKDPAKRAQKLIQIALRLHPKQSLASLVRKK